MTASIDGPVTNVTDADIGEFTTGGYSVVDFFAPWCGPCHQLATVLDAAAGRHRSLRFGRCDVDENPQTAARLGIMSIPTLVIFDASGAEVDRMVGAAGARQLDSFLRQAVTGAA